MRALISRTLRGANLGAVAGWYQQICSAVAGLAVIPLMLKRWGDADTGVWVTTQAWVALAGLADFGLSIVIARQTAFALGRGESVRTGGESGGQAGDRLGAVHSIYLRATRVNLFACALVALVGVGLLFVHSVTDGPEERWGGVVFLGTMVAVAIIRLVGRPHASVVEGWGSLALVRFVAGSSQLLSAAGWIICLLAGAGLPVLAFWLLCAVSAETLTYAALARRLFRHSSPRAHESDRSFMKDALPLGAVNLGSYLYSNVQAPMITAALGPAAAVPYYVAQRLGQFLTIGVLQLVTSALPTFTRHVGARQVGAARELMRSRIQTAVVLSLPIAAIMYWALPEISRRFFHTEPLMPFPRALMAVDVALLTVSSACTQFVFASGRNPFFWWTIACGLLNVGLLALMLPSLALVAVPLASLAAAAVTMYWRSIIESRALIRELEARGQSGEG